jgi:hypothetical protein
MKKGETREIQTVRVKSAQTLATPDGRVAILLDTQEVGPIAFEVNLEAIDSLRRKLTDAETFLRIAKRQA